MCKLAKKGLTPSQIGVILRDSHGIAQASWGREGCYGCVAEALLLLEWWASSEGGPHVGPSMTQGRRVRAVLRTWGFGHLATDVACCTVT